MIKKITSWWYRQDPAMQYMTWIITFCLMLSSFLFLLTTYESLFRIEASMISLITVGIVGFVSFFIFVVLFLTFFWPHHYEKAQKENEVVNE